MKFTLRQLEIFLEVVRDQQLISAAEKMGISQGAVSMAIKALETAFGKPLFERIGKKLVPNEFGRRFAADVAEPFHRMQAIQQGILAGEGSGEIAVGASSTLADYILPATACRFMEAHPDTKVALSMGNTQEIIDLVLTGKVDVGYVEGEVREARLHVETIGVDELVVVTGDQALAKAGERKIDALLAKRWVLREPGSGTREIFLARLGNQAQKLNIVMELGHIEAIKRTLEYPDYVSCLSRICVREKLERQKLYEIPVTGMRFHRNFYKIRRAEKEENSLLKGFEEMVREDVAL